MCLQEQELILVDPERGEEEERNFNTLGAEQCVHTMSMHL
jgi:hypothetical protein